MSNYPSGTSAGDPRAPWNAPDTSHEHEFREVEESPIFEDGAAIFREECTHETVLNAEEGYEGETVVTESIPCEEYRLTRLDPTTVELVNVEKEIDVPDEHDDWTQRIHDALIAIEIHADDVTIEDVDPPDGSDDGRVVARCGNFRIIYGHDS